MLYWALAEGNLACNTNATCSHHEEHHEGGAESVAAQLPDALSADVPKSSRLMAEDLCRETGES